MHVVQVKLHKMQNSSLPSINKAIGARVGAARKTLGLTLSQLSARCTLSESFLSRLERGQASASIANLLQICAALQVEISDLFAGLQGAALKTRVSVHRGGDRELSVVETTGYRWRCIGGGNLQDEMEVFYLVFPKDERMESFVSHPGQEHCYVISGEVLFDVVDESHHLCAGDGIFIDSTLPHRARNLGSSEAHVLMTVSSSNNSQVPFDWWRPANPIANPTGLGTSNGGRKHE